MKTLNETIAYAAAGLTGAARMGAEQAARRLFLAKAAKSTPAPDDEDAEPPPKREPAKSAKRAKKASGKKLKKPVTRVKSKPVVIEPKDDDEEHDDHDQDDDDDDDDEKASLGTHKSSTYFRATVGAVPTAGKTAEAKADETLIARGYLTKGSKQPTGSRMHADRRLNAGEGEAAKIRRTVLGEAYR